MKNTILTTLVSMVMIFGGIYLFPWSDIDWGKLENGQAKVIRVVGSADSKSANEVANFSATVSSINDKKDVAVAEVNGKIDEIIKSLKEFGIKDEDLKTTNLSIYQQEEPYYQDGVQKFKPGQWRVNNTVEVSLKEVSRADALSDLLSKSSATSVWGPNFGLAESGEAESMLVELALKNAMEKAQKLASAAGVELGKVVSVAEIEANTIPYASEMGGGGGGAKLEPGTTKVTKSLDVVFEIK